MSHAHTPGPWVWNESQHYLCPAHHDPERSAVHTILDVDRGGSGFIMSDRAATSRELAADYQLIEAAPLLFEALLEAENALADYVDRLEMPSCHMGYGNAVLRQVRAALAAAAPPPDTRARAPGPITAVFVDEAHLFDDPVPPATHS